MTRREFLNNLYSRLGNLSREQAEQHLMYYAEMLADRMEEGMSEEEAVASMEPVDTIARRILQDEGVPPVYPDPAPSGKGSGGEEPPRKQPPVRRQRNWRRPAQIALWALAITALAFSAARKLWGFRWSMGSDTPVIEDAVPADNPSPGWPEAEERFGTLELGGDGIDIDGFHIGSDGIWYSEGEETFYMGPDGIQYDGDDGSFYMGPGGIRVEEKDLEALEAVEVDTEGPFYELPGSGITAMSVQWSGGQVEIAAWGGDTIQFQEERDAFVTSSTLSHVLDGELLTITGGSSDSRLKLLVPRSWEHVLEIGGGAAVWASDLKVGNLVVNTTSEDVICSNLDVDYLTVRTTSGDIVLSDISAASTLEAGTSSGDVVLSSVKGTDAVISTTSGGVTGTGGASNWNVSTSSGDISLFPFQSDNLSLNTASGQIYLAPARNTNTISMTTTSGDVELLAPDQNFYLRYDTSSGSLDQGGISLRAGSGGEYWRGDGNGCTIYVGTTSGDLTLYEA